MKLKFLGIEKEYLLISLCLCTAVNISIAQNAWPAEDWNTAVDLTSLDNDWAGQNNSGVYWNPATRKLWVCNNNTGGGFAKFWRIKEDGAGSFMVDNTGGYAEWSYSGDLEGIVQADQSSTVFAIDENALTIREFDVSTPGATNLLHSWNISANVEAMAGSDGPDGIAFVPNSYLTANGFVDQNGNPYTAVNGLGGLIFLNHQNGGHIYAFDLNRTGDTYTYVGKYSTDYDKTSEITFDLSLGKMFIWHKGGYAGLYRMSVTNLSSTAVGGSPIVRSFNVSNTYYGPKSTGNIEGLAFTHANTNEHWAWCIDDGCENGSSVRWFKNFGPCEMSPTLVTSGGATIVTGNSTSLSVTGSSTFTWAPPASLNTSSGNNVIASPTTSTTYSVNSTVGCFPTATISVVVQPCSAVGGTVTAVANPISSGQNTNIILTSYTATSLQWQISSDGISYSDISGVTSYTMNTGALTLTTYYRCKVNGTSCFVYSTVETVVISCSAVGGTATAVDNTLASGQNTNITLTSYSATSLQWQISSDGLSYSDISGVTSYTMNTGALTSTRYYRCKVNGSACFVYSTVVTITINSSTLSGYIYRKKITIDETKVSGSSNFVDFPVLVSFTDPDLRTVANGGKVQNVNGYDVDFTQSDGETILDHYVEKHNVVTGEYIAWVKIPIMTYSVNTVIYIYYGNCSISSDQAENTIWDSNYKGVWHLPNGTTLTAADNTSNGNNGTLQNTPTATTAKIGGGGAFVGSSSQYISVGSTMGFSGVNTSITIEGWAYRAATNQHGAFFKIGNRTDASGGDGFAIGVGSGNLESSGNNLLALYEGIRWIDSGTNFGTGWHQFALVINSSGKPAIYYDGVSLYSDAGTNARTVGSMGTSVAQIAGYSGSGSENRYFTGSLDEIRVSNTARSSDWILTGYNNQNSPSTFYAVGAEEGVSGGIATAFDNTLFSGENTDIVLTDYTGTSLQWQLSTNGSSYSDISGATSATINTGALTATTYYRCKIENGGCYIYSNVETVTINLQFLSGYTYRKKITIDKTKVSGSSNLSNFPVLVSFTDPDLRTVANGGKVTNASGYDIDFTQSDGATILDHQVERHDLTTGQYIAWVRIPTLSYTANTEIYMYYGNCRIEDDQTENTTWDSNYKGVWHLPNGTTLTAADNTSNGNNGTLQNTPTATTAKIGGGGAFVGSSSQYISVGSTMGFSGVNTSITIEGWAYRAATNQHGAFFKIGNRSDGSGGDGFAIGVGASPNPFESSGNNLLALYEGIRWIDSGTNFGTGWHQFALVINSSGKPAIYYDGVSLYSDAGTNARTVGSMGTSVAQIAGYSGSGSENRYFTGSLDEIRVSNTARSSDWILTGYNNQNSPSTFYAVGAEEGMAGWSGVTSSAWNDGNNWTTCSVPASGSNIYIPNVSPNPFPVLDMSRTIGSLLIYSGASATVSGYNLTVTGDIINDGTLTTTTGTVTLVGSTQQLLKGSAALAFNNLTINNSKVATAVVLSKSVTVNGALTLTDGHVVTTSTKILTLGSGSSIALNGSPQDSSFVKGPMNCIVASAAAKTLIFPIGKTNSYRRADLAIDQNAATATKYTAEMFNIAATSLPYTYPATIDRVSSIRYYDISQEATGVGLDDAKATIYYGTDDGVTDMANLRIVKTNGSPVWVDIGGTGSANGTGFIQSVSFNTFSYFALANHIGGTNPLPIELISFTGNCILLSGTKRQSVELKWTTSGEINNDYFTVERSFDVQNFETVGQLKGAGNSSISQNYSLIDDHPYLLTYYRLKQTDFDGKFKYSKIISVENCTEDFTELIIYPNPASGTLNCLFNGNKEQVRSVELFNVLGERIYYSGGYQSTINLSGIHNGIYFIHFNLKAKIIVEKIVIE